jgi:hypothetical protein
MSMQDKPTAERVPSGSSIHGAKVGAIVGASVGAEVGVLPKLVVDISRYSNVPNGNETPLCTVGVVVGTTMEEAHTVSIALAEAAVVGVNAGGQVLKEPRRGSARLDCGIHAVNTSVAEAPFEKVCGPATATSHPTTFKVQDAPVQPST